VAVDVEKRRANRLRVMKAIFEESGGSETELVDTAQLRNDLALSDTELADARNYLEGEGLITARYRVLGQLSPIAVQIRHRVSRRWSSLREPRLGRQSISRRPSPSRPSTALL
jgi:hypothetical protein